jgi:non-specific serine/threonine protein kinase/serine/threonine-protein kinase
MSDQDDILTRTTAAGETRTGGSVGPYRLLQRLGQGGMGDVWLAEQSRPVRRQVAIKVIRTGMDTSSVVARFDAERQALAMMEHPCVAKILDAGTTALGRPYFAMEYVRGETITQYCDRHRLSIRERLRLFAELCDGVHHAHQKGIIHRDLKPSNILVTVQGDRPVPRIIDFGIAKAIAQPLTDGTLLTELGALIGTPEYMSPEQADLTSLDVDTRTDVYSLGVILYELLTGKLPFDMQKLRAAGLDELRRTIREKEAPRPSTRVKQEEGSEDVAANRRTDAHKLAQTLDGDLDWIVLKALEKDRTRRYESAAAFGLDIGNYLSNEPVRARPPSATYKMRKFVRRHRIGVASIAAIALLLIGVSVLTELQARKIAGERNRADREAAAARQEADFLASLFKAPDPNLAQGATVTARQLLARGAQQIAEKLRDQPEVRARLESIIGDVYTSLGMYGEAEPLLLSAVHLQRTVRGNADAETLTTINRLANLRWYQERFEEAEPLYREVVEQRTRTLGPEHRSTLAANFDLASLYVLQKRYTEAESLTLRIIEIQRRVLGVDDADTVDSLDPVPYCPLVTEKAAAAHRAV